MPQLGSSGIQALVSSFTDKDVDQALKEIALKIARSVDDVNDQLNKISIDKDVVNNLVNQIKALPEEVRKKTQGMSFDLFSDLINADGAEEKIDEAFKTFTNKIQSFVKLRDQIGNDELIIKADYSQIDELIGKTERLLELQKELDKWQSGKSRTKKSINADISSVESEIKSGISNLNVSGGQVGVGVNVDNEALAELDKKIKETEESLKSAREEAEKYGGSLDVLKKKIDQTYNKSVDKDTQKNADNFREAVQNYIKAGGSQKDLDKDYLSWYKLLGESWPKNFIPLNQITNESEKAQEKVKELESVLDDLYKQRDELIKGTGSRTGDGVGFEASKEEAEDLLSVIKEIRDVLNQFKENKSLLNSEEINTLKQRISELDTQISDIQTKLQNIGKDSFDGTVNDANELLNKLENVYDQITFVQDKLQGLDDNVFSGMKTDIDNLVNKFDVMNEQLQEFINLSSKADVPEMKTQNEVNDKDNINSNFDNSDAIKGQNKLQLELDETKGKIQEVGTEAQEAKQKIEDLGRIDVNPEVNPKETSAPSHTLEKDISQTDSSSIISEQQALEKLEQAIISVTTMIGQKNLAIQAEEVQMDSSVNQEIKKLEALKGKLTEIKTQFEQGITSELFKNTKDADGEDINGTSINVDLKPTVDANKFKEDAERLLAFVDVEKEVSLKAGELDASGITGTNTVTFPVSENISNDNVIEEQNKDLEEQQFLYNNIIRLLTEYLSLQDRINSGNQNIVNGNLIYHNDIRKQTGKVSQRAVKDQLNNYLRASKNENGIYNDNSIKRAKEQLSAYVANFDNAEKAAEIFGNKNKELFNEICQMIDNAKVSLDAYNEAQLKIDVAEDQLAKLNKLQSDEKLTYGQLWNLEKIVKTDGLEAGLKYITDELGIKIPEAAKKAESAIAGVNDELSNPQQLQQPQVKPVENDTGNDQDGKKSGVIQVPVEPLLVQSEWEEEIDRILGLINKNPRKVKIVPDTSSKEWNEFTTFVNEISNKVIQLKINEDNRSKNTLPSDLKASYTNSTKYVTELYKIEEKIAQAKETGNKKDLERLATLEAEKKKYEDLLNLEKQFRSDDRFKDFDTTSQENALNKLISTKMQEYQSNRQVAAVRIEEEAYNENQKFDENKRLEEATALLEQQKVKWEEIQNIKIKISTLDPVNDVDEINNLNAQKSNLESELSTIEKELNLYDSLIDKKKQSNELDKIASNASKQVNDNTLERVNKLYNDYVNNISEQSQLELKGTDRTDEEEQRLVQLRQEYLDLTEKVNIALTEEQNKTTAISKVLENIKIAQDLGVSGILRNNDVDQGYEQANKINNALNTTSQRMNDIKKQGQTDFFGHLFSNAENKITDLNNKLVNNKITLTEYSKEVGRIQSLLSKQTNAVAFINSGDMDEVSTQMKEIASQIPGIQADTIKWSNGNKTLTALIKDQNNEWKKLTLNAQTASGVITRTFTTSQAPATSLSKLLDELGSKFRNLTAYILSFVSFYEIWAQIKQGVTYVKELDSAFTEMRKVSDETTESLKEFQKESFDIADSVGATAKVIQNSTAEWMRLGESIEEAAKSAEVSNILLNVSEFEDIDSATDALVSMSQAYQNLDKIDIVDKMNNIGM